MIKKAICVPTYNRGEVIEDLLHKCIQLYSNYGYDIYIYDSSENDDTEIRVRRYQADFSNLFYVRMPSDMHSNLKTYRIFQGYCQKKTYDYIWVCSDVLHWSRTVLDKAEEQYTGSYDLIVINYRDYEHLGNRIYKDAQEFFEDCCWHMTLYGAVIINTATILKNADWKYLEEKYCIPERINHSHVAMYFEQILKCSSFSASYLAVSFHDVDISTIRKKSGWWDNTFFVWAECFPNMIMAIPEYYRNRNSVIKKNGVLGDIFNERGLVRLKRTGVLNRAVFWKYLTRWKILSDQKLFYIAALAMNKGDAAYIKRRDRKIQHVLHFCKNHNRIYLYGTGVYAKWYYNILAGNGIMPKGFLVSCAENNPSELFETGVFEFRNIDMADRGTGIILSLDMHNAEDVKKMLVNKGCIDDLFDDIVDVDLE